MPIFVEIPLVPLEPMLQWEPAWPSEPPETVVSEQCVFVEDGCGDLCRGPVSHTGCSCSAEPRFDLCEEHQQFVWGRITCWFHGDVDFDDDEEDEV
jgi:hypothetical protein